MEFYLNQYASVESCSPLSASATSSVCNTLIVFVYAVIIMMVEKRGQLAVYSVCSEYCSVDIWHQDMTWIAIVLYRSSFDEHFSDLSLLYRQC